MRSLVLKILTSGAIFSFAPENNSTTPNILWIYVDDMNDWMGCYGDKLTPLQASYHEASERPDEELYDVINDSNQLNNLAKDSTYASVLKRHRKYLKSWEVKTDDKGMYPASVEDLKKVYEKAPDKCVNPEYDIFREN